MTMVDDHSKYCNLYLLKRKSEVAGKTDKVKEDVRNMFRTNFEKRQRESDLIGAEKTPEKSYRNS